MMNSDPMEDTKALTLRSRAQDAAVIELGRELVATLRFVHYYTEAEITGELA